MYSITLPRKAEATWSDWNIETANRFVESITNRFFFLSGFPHLGRSRDSDLGRGIRSFSVGDYVILYCVELDGISVLRVVHGRRTIDSLFVAEPESDS